MMLFDERTVNTQSTFPSLYHTSVTYTNTNALVDNTPQTKPTITKDIEMSTAIYDERRYLLGRIRDIEDIKYVDARRKYGYLNDNAPCTAEEMKQRLEEGKYIVVSDYKDGRYPAIRWRDPSVKEDEEGFSASRKAFDIVKQKAQDAANILPPVEALKSLQELEAFEV